MEKHLIFRGLLVGALGGLLAFVFGRIFAEPVISRAIDYESARDAAQDALDKAAGIATDTEGPEVFTRTIQSNIGIGFGMIVFGIAMGALFAVVYAVCAGRVGNISPRNLSLLVAGAMFTGMYLVPFLKYPANPPSIGHPDTIKERTGLYLLMVVCALAFMVAAVWLGRRLQPRFGNWSATLMAGGAYVIAIGILMLVLPPLGHLSENRKDFGDFASETPQPLKDASGTIVFPGFSADDLFSFRMDSIAAQAILWAAIGIGFAPLAARLYGRGADRVRTSA